MKTNSSAVLGESLLVEAEGFDSHGGWSPDQQFMQTMGSPYRLLFEISSFKISR